MLCKNHDIDSQPCALRREYGEYTPSEEIFLD